MKLFGFGDRVVASKAIATVLAEMIIKEIYGGEEELKVQQPLQITETADSWIVVGSRDYDFESTALDQVADGQITIEILKRNCRVIKMIQQASFVPQAFSSTPTS